MKKRKNVYSITNKDITNTVMQLGRGCRIDVFIAVQLLTVCVFTVYSVVVVFLLFSSSAIHLL